MIGKKIRLERIINRTTGKTIIVPMDHGITAGPIDGISNLKTSVQKVAEGGANAVIEHKGAVEEGLRGGGPDIGLIVHLSASTSMSVFPNSKTIVCSVDEAIRLGADAVSVHVNLGGSEEKNMLNDFGRISYEAMQWGMPVIAMMYPRGEKIKDEYDVQAVKHAARVGAEMGADIVKVSYTGSRETFMEVVDGCFVPVVIAGGPKMDSDRDILEMVKGSLDAGGSGVSIGRNAFQHRTPEKIIRAFSALVHENVEVEDAMEILRN
ncbi:MAG: fructose-bisphosphate aldolase [Deltaproteobacteria bacterium]|nr:MAG: fructose-bisphosphate aldolase [Deltaproteobacteria bacterium]